MYSLSFSSLACFLTLEMNPSFLVFDELMKIGLYDDFLLIAFEMEEFAFIGRVGCWVKGEAYVEALVVGLIL